MTFFTALLWLLLVSSANLLLVNQSWALRGSDGATLIGPRDVVQVAVISSGVASLTAKTLSHLRPRLPIIMAGIILLLVPVSLLVGSWNDATAGTVGHELAIVTSWLLLFAIPAKLCHIRQLESLMTSLVTVGILISVGIIAEVATGMSLVLVSTTGLDTILSNRSYRPTPVGWPVMLVAATSLAIDLIIGRQRRSLDSLWRALLLGVVITAMVLTQSRTFLVAFSGALIAIAVAAALTGKRMNVAYAALIFASPFIAVFGAAAAVEALFPERKSVLLERFSILVGGSLLEYSTEVDSRGREMGMAIDTVLLNPLSGTGLGASYRPPLYPGEIITLITHNSLSFYGTRFGVIGAVLFSLVGLSIAHCVLTTLRQSTVATSLVGVKFALGAFALLIASWSGNCFGANYLVQQSLVVIAGLVVYHTISRRVGGGSYGTV